MNRVWVDLALAATLATNAHAAPTLIRSVRVFDGKAVIPRTDVLVDGGVIARVAPGQKAPAGATVLDGAGKTLLPGLIDAHAHTFPGALEDAAVFGVTTELDMFADVAFVRATKAKEAKGENAQAADLRSAGTLVTAPGGHGTEYGMKIPTIQAPEEARGFVDARLAEGSDYIKVVYDDGATYGMHIPTISRATLKAVVDAAHRRGKLAVVHIGSQQGAREAIEAGADGLAHLFVDGPPTADFAALLKARKAFVVPTLSVNESVTGTPSGARLAEDARLAAYVTPANARNLRASFPARESLRSGLANAMMTVRQLDSLGVPLLAGTDAPNPGTVHGLSMHRELELLVQAGLTPAEALTAATWAPARIFGLPDRGRIAKGLRADLLLVNGDPTRDIMTTREIAGVWKRGVPIDRAAYAAAVAKANQEAAAGAKNAAVAVGAGLISDFDDGTLGSKFGSGWMVSTDEIAGGQSKARMEPAPGGAQGTAGDMRIQGTIAPGLPYAWAGAMFSPGAAPMSPADVTPKKEIAFWAKGDGKQYRIMLFSQKTGRIPLVKTFTATSEWQEISFPFSAFGDIDGHDLMAVVFAGGPEPGEFAFQLDGIRLR